MPIPSYPSVLDWLRTSLRNRSSSDAMHVWLLRLIFGITIIGLGWIAFDQFRTLRDDPGNGVKT